jgi:hypothetical protein
MLEVVFPHSFVLGAIYVLVNTWSVRLVIGPKAIIDIAIDMSECAFAMCSVFSPFTIVPCAIGPDLDTLSVTEAALPLSSVDGTSLEGVWCSLLAWLVRVVKSFSYCLTGLFLCEVLAAAQLLGFQK